MLEEVEGFILSSSETLNEKLEDIQKQMGDLNSEIVANVEIVKEKKRSGSGDTMQFVEVLGEDVRQFIWCMREELTGVIQALQERDDKCRADVTKLEHQIT